MKDLDLTGESVLGPITTAVSGEIVEPSSEPDVVSEDDALSELRSEVDDAIDFMSEFADEWETAQDYFDGKTDLPITEGRSKAVSPNVANAIRGAMPSIMRTMLASGQIVEYMPHSRMSSAIAAQQTIYVNTLFERAGGYTIISSVAMNAALKRGGPVQWSYNKKRTPRFVNLTGLMQPQVEAMLNNPQIKVVDQDVSLIEVTAPTGEVTQMPTYSVTAAYIEEEGEIVIEAIPLPDFFMSRNATSCEDARVCGTRRNMRIGDLMALGIEWDLLEDLDNYDPEVSDSGSGEASARRTKPKDDESKSADPTMREVLVTQVYARFDLDGLGTPALWRFLLGGTERKLLLKERVTRVQICLGRIDLIPHTAIGGSIFERSKADQDTITSLLRGTIDNLHMSNNRRLAIHESLVNLNDVMSGKIGAPIRVRAAGQIQEIGVQPMVGAALPLLQYLDAAAQTRVGVTAAAMGLDPDALQSTDKDAVRNTIQLSQGQIELFARNLAESLVPLFKGLLELSMTHLPREQSILVGERAIPIDQQTFDPTFFMRPKVGLGTENVEQQRAILQTVYQEQKAMLTAQPANPICTYHHLSNTLEDLLRLANVNNPDRYFNDISKETGDKLMQEAADAASKAAEAAAKAPNPVEAMLQAEAIKAAGAENQTKIKAAGDQRAKSLELQYRALELNAKDDLERDKLAQEKYLADAQLKHTADLAAIEKEQDAERKPVV